MALAASVTSNTTYAYNTVTITGLTSVSPAYDTVLVQRVNPDGSFWTCRNANSVLTGGGDSFVFTDYEAPMNGACYYYVTATRHNSDGSTTVGNVSSGLATLPLAYAKVWLKSLSQPNLSVLGTLSTISDITRNARQMVNSIINSPYPVILSDVQQTRVGTFTFTTSTLTDRTNFLNLVTSGEPILFQANSAPNGGDGFEDMYFMVGDVTEQRPSGFSTDPTRQWQVLFTEVAMPLGILTMIPGSSWLSVTQFNSWQNVQNNRATWLTVLNTPYGFGNPV